MKQNRTLSDPKLAKMLDKYKIRPEDVKKAGKGYFERVRSEILIHGNIDITDGIAISTVQSLINLEFEGRPLPSGNAIIRNPVSGAVERIERGWANLAVLEVAGIDLRANYLLETGVGDFRFDLAHSQIVKDKSASTPISPPEAG